MTEKEHVLTRNFATRSSPATTKRSRGLWVGRVRCGAYELNAASHVWFWLWGQTVDRSQTTWGVWVVLNGSLPDGKPASWELRDVVQFLGLGSDSGLSPGLHGLGLWSKWHQVMSLEAASVYKWKMERRRRRERSSSRLLTTSRTKRPNLIKLSVVLNCG